MGNKCKNNGETNLLVVTVWQQLLRNTIVLALRVDSTVRPYLYKHGKNKFELYIHNIYIHPLLLVFLYTRNAYTKEKLKGINRKLLFDSPIVEWK